MDSGNAVNGKSVVDINMRHMHPLVLVNDLHLGVLVFFCHPLIQLFDIGDKLGHYLFQVSKGPFFQRFRQDRMVGISAGFAHHFNGLIHGKCLFLHQDADQLRNYHGRMGIVDLDHRMFIHLTQVVFLFLHFPEDKLGGIAHHKILLVDPQQVPCLVRVVRIQKQGQVLFNLFLIKGNAILHYALVNGLNIKKPQLVHAAVIACNINIVKP